MTAFSELQTPAVLIDLDRVEANLSRAQDYADSHGLKLRPHIKTHKLPRFAKRAMELGAVGITVQKLGEAETMADAGISEIFLPYNIIGHAKLARLKALRGAVARSSACTCPHHRRCARSPFWWPDDLPGRWTGRRQCCLATGRPPGTDCCRPAAADRFQWRHARSVARP